MKKTAYVLCILTLGGAIGSQAALVANLNGGADGPTTVFTYSNLEGTVGFDGGTLGNAVDLTESTVTGASGSFSVSVTAVSNMVASSWSQVGGTSDLNTQNNGWGIVGNTGTQMDGPEAMLLAFNVSNLVLGDGQELVFSIGNADDSDSFQIYQKVGTVGSLVTSKKRYDGSMSANTSVDGLLEFAVTDAGYDGGAALRFTTFTVDVIPEPATLGMVASLGASLFFIRRRLIL